MTLLEKVIEWPVAYSNEKYAKWYNSLITKAQSRTITGYVEKHHIVPRSFGGNNSKANLVSLTAREHFIAHKLLWKMKFFGVYGSKMAFAFGTFINKMTNGSRAQHHTYTISSRTFEVFRKEYSKVLKEKWAREGANFKGKKHSDETKRKIGEKSKLKEFKRGPENPQWGKKKNISPEEKAKRSDNSKARWADPGWRDRVLEKMKDSNKRPEVVAARKMAADARVGVKRDSLSVEKGASKKRGKKAHEIFSPQALENIAEGRKHRVYTPEGKAKQIETSRKNGMLPKSADWRRQMSERMTGIKRTTVVCKHCGKECVLSNHNRWHGNNCKLKRD